MRSGSREDGLLNMGELLEDLQIEDELGLKNPAIAESADPTGPASSDDKTKIYATGDPSVDPVTGFSEDTVTLGDPEADPQDPDKPVVQKASDESVTDQPDENPSSVMVDEPGDSPEPGGGEADGPDTNQPEHVPSSTES